MNKLHFALVAIVLTYCAGHCELSWGRGFGGMHGGARPGGNMGGARPGGNFGGARPGGNFAGARPGGNFGGARPDFGGARPGGNLGGARPGGVGTGPGSNFGGAGRGKIYGGASPGGQFGGANRPAAGGRGAGRFPGAGASGFGHTGPGAADMAKRPDRSQLSNFLGMPSDGGMHKLSASHVHVGKTQIGGTDVNRNQVGRNQIGRDARGMSRHPDDDLRRRGDYVRRGFDGRGYYTRDWYRRYPRAWYPRAWARNDMWAALTWEEMYGYMGYGYTDPMYYDYGNTVTYQNNSVYMNGQDLGTSDEYYDQAQSLAETGTQAQPAEDQQWMPLGVFAITHGDHTKADLILQLAVNKDGVIRGNYTAKLTNHTLPVHGSVDKKTQRAAWTIGDNKDNVIETGIYNLTKDEAPALAHFGKDKTEQCVLVRLNKDGDDGSQGDGTPSDDAQGDGTTPSAEK